MDDVTRLYREIHNSDGSFKTSFNWLDSPWPAEKWKIRDRFNPELPRHTIVFKVPAMPGKTFLDLPAILEDIRKIIATIVELGNPAWGVECDSRSSIRRVGQVVLRIYREVFDMGLRDLASVTEKDVLELRNRLLLPEDISQSYSEKIERVVSQLGIEGLPVQIITSKKRPSSIDRPRLKLLAGIANHRTSGECKQIFNDLNQTLASMYPEYKWEPPKNYQDSSFVSEKRAKDIASVLKVIYSQSQCLNDLSAPLKVNPFPDWDPGDFVDYSIKRQQLVTRQSRGRTRNIPVPTFLHLMDAAVRWVADYADPLFDLEADLSAEFANLGGSVSEDRVCRIVNGLARELSSSSKWAWKPSSPFPVASYRHHRSKSDSKYDEGTINEIERLLEKGMFCREIGEQLGLSKNAVEGIQSRHIRDIYNHNLETTGVSLNYALYGFLPFCCAVILLAFTAGRESSIADLRKGCMRRIAGLRYINLYVPKTHRSYQDLPTVALVEKAVDVLERLSASARESTGSDCLFQFDDIVADRIKGMRFDTVYPNFFNHIGMPRDEQGNHWVLSEHQFRRFFAIMFFYRYGSAHEASFEALMYYLRHTDWTNTDIYLTEREQGRIFREVEEEWLSHVIARGNPQDESLQALKRDVQNSVWNSTQVVREQQAERALQRIQKDDLTVEFLNFGAVCLGLSPGREQVAQCAIETESGEKAVCLHKASEKLCKGCKNLVEAEFLFAQKTPESDSLTHLACDSPILDAVIATDRGQ